MGRWQSIGLAIAVASALAGQSVAATAQKISGSDQIRLDPEKGDVRSALEALASTIGAKVTGDSQLLSTPAPAAPITGTPERLLRRLLREQDYVLKTDAAGHIREVVIMSGARGQDPVAHPTQAAPQTPTAPPTPYQAPATTLVQATPSYGAPSIASKASAGAGAGTPVPPASVPTMAGGNPTAPGAPITITPEMQADIAKATLQAQGQLKILVDQLKAACPEGQHC